MSPIEKMSLGLVFSILPLHCAMARPMRVMESFPVARAVVDGRNAQYFVRFDGPVDHRASRLLITQGSRTIESLHPLLDAAPEVLFGSAPRLPAGQYELHWWAKSLPEGDITEGSIQFIVKD